MKIKTKKEMNLPELIEWLWKSKKSVYKVTSNMNGVVKLEPYGLITFSSGDFYPEETFTVEVEKEITEDTKINKLLVKFKSPSRYQIFCNDCINGFEIEEGNIEAFYVLNDDLTLTLIWKNGKMVD